MSNTERHKQVVERAFAAWDEGDAETFPDVYARDVVHHDLEIDGVDELQELVPLWFAAFPDLSHSVEAMIAEDEWVATRFTISGTHEGEFQGIDPTGETFEIRGVAMERVEGGKITERWLVEPVLEIYRQLGVLEVPTE